MSIDTSTLPLGDLEQISALAAGELEENERQEVLARIAEDETLFAIYSELVEVLEESAAPQPVPADGGKADSPSPFSSEPGTPRAATTDSTRGLPFPRLIVDLAAAAAIIGAVFGIFVYMLDDGSPAPSPNGVNADLIDPTRHDSLFRPIWNDDNTRRSVPSGNADAVKSGALMATLQLAVEVEAYPQAIQLLDDLSDLTELRDSTELVELRNALQDKSTSDLPSALGNALDRVRDEFPYDEADFDLGQWAERGRLAAVIGDETYLRSDDTITQGRSLAIREPDELISEDLSKIVDKLEDQSLDTGLLTKALTDLLLDKTEPLGS